MNHSETIWIYLFVYFSARFFFLDIRLMLEPGTVRPVFPIRSIIYGGVFLLFVAHLWLAAALFVIHAFVVSIEFFALRSKRIPVRLVYLGQLILAFIFIPLFINQFSLIIPRTYNQVHVFFVSLFQRTAYLTPILQAHWIGKLAAVSTGFIFTLKEATIIIRFALQRIRIAPHDAKEPDKQDAIEYERGRLIGNLERSLIYSLILYNQIGAIAIIIALKSLARFKKMDDKDFAEYFLIGSFLSIIMAAIPAILVKYLVRM